MARAQQRWRLVDGMADLPDWFGTEAIALDFDVPPEALEGAEVRVAQALIEMFVQADGQSDPAAGGVIEHELESASDLQMGSLSRSELL
jgi:hypothetical protein